VILLQCAGMLGDLNRIMTSKEANKLYRVLSWLAVFFWIILIFSLSHQPANQTNELSIYVTKTILEIIEEFTPSKEFNLINYNLTIRKFAHFFIYLILGTLSMYALNKSRIIGLKASILSLLFIIIFAISDELHQLFIPGRGSGLWDVLIDIYGAFTGIIAYLIISKVRLA
jgi:VanZ family protein